MIPGSAPRPELHTRLVSDQLLSNVIPVLARRPAAVHLVVSAHLQVEDEHLARSLVEWGSEVHVHAAGPRFEVISGWDLASWKPKPAGRAVPAGAVYWFDEIDGDPGKLAESIAGGLWRDNPDASRRAEGYNNALLAAWPQH